MGNHRNRDGASILPTVCLASLLLALILSIVVLASVPPVDRDALTHHLAVPKLYLKNGGIYEIPSVLFSYYPMNLDLLYMIPLYFGNDIIPKYIHFAFALVTALQIFIYLKKRISSTYGAFGSLFFLSMPVIVKLSMTVYVDLGLICFSTTALLCMLGWLDNPSKTRYLLFSAIACGLCLGTKYNGLITLFLLSSFVPLCYIRTHRQAASSGSLPDPPNTSRRSDAMQETFRAVGYVVVFVAVALIIFSPWMIRNYVWTKNPIYPLYGSIFSHKQTSSSSVSDDSISTEMREDLEDENQAMNHFLIRRHIYQEPLWKTLLIPIRIFFEGRDDNPKYFDGRLNPFLLLLPMAAFIRTNSYPGRIRRDKLIFLSFAILYILFAFFTADMRIRYVSPIIPPLVILSAYGLHNLAYLLTCNRSKQVYKIMNTAGGVSVLFLFSLNASYIAEQFRLMRPQDYVFGKVDRDFYIQQCRPEYTVIQYANRHLPEDAKILGLFLGNRSYYCDRELLFGEKLLIKMLNRAQSSDELLAHVKKRGFTHIVVNLPEYTASYGRSLTGSEQQRLLHFFRDKLTLLQSHDGYQLFKI